MKNRIQLSRKLRPLSNNELAMVQGATGVIVQVNALDDGIGTSPSGIGTSPSAPSGIGTSPSLPR